MKWVLTFLTAVLIVLHQDFWNWAKVEPQVFRFLPVGMWYHGLFCVAAAIMMALWVAFLWPAHLEDVQPEPGLARDPSIGGH